MTGFALPRARSRRRRPLPPDWWKALLMFVWCVGMAVFALLVAIHGTWASMAVASVIFVGVAWAAWLRVRLLDRPVDEETLRLAEAIFAWMRPLQLLALVLWIIELATGRYS